MRVRTRCCRSSCSRCSCLKKRRKHASAYRSCSNNVALVCAQPPSGPDPGPEPGMATPGASAGVDAEATKGATDDAAAAFAGAASGIASASRARALLGLTKRTTRTTPALGMAEAAAAAVASREGDDPAPPPALTPAPPDPAAALAAAVMSDESDAAPGERGPFEPRRERAPRAAEADADAAEEEMEAATPPPPAPAPAAGVEPVPDAAGRRSIARCVSAGATSTGTSVAFRFLLTSRSARCVERGEARGGVKRADEGGSR